MSNRCLFCHREGKTHPVKSWNNDEIKYYCDQHVNQAQVNQRNSAFTFYKYYKNNETRNWLSDKGLNLWKKLDNEYKGRGNH